MVESTQEVAPGTFRADAHADLFGFPPEPVRVTIRPRSRGWRMAGAARTMGIAVVVAPFVAVVPPHAPWLIGALSLGAILARRRWTERFTLVGFEGRCPKCAGEFHIKAGRLRRPHGLACETCHHQSRLQLPDGVLESHAAETE